MAVKQESKKEPLEVVQQPFVLSTGLAVEAPGWQAVQIFSAVPANWARQEGAALE